MDGTGQDNQNQIKVTGPDGKVVYFPKGTPPQMIDEEMQKFYAQSSRSKPEIPVNLPPAGENEGPSIGNFFRNLWNQVRTPGFRTEELSRKVLPEREMKGPLMSFGPLGPGGANIQKEQAAGGLLGAARLIDTMSRPDVAAFAYGAGRLGAQGFPGFALTGGLSADMLLNAYREAKNAQAIPEGALPRERTAGKVTAVLDALMALAPWLNEGRKVPEIKLPRRPELPPAFQGEPNEKFMGEAERIPAEPTIPEPIAPPPGPPPPVRTERPLPEWVLRRQAEEAAKAKAYQEEMVRRQPPPWSQQAEQEFAVAKAGGEQKPEGPLGLQGEVPEVTERTSEEPVPFEFEDLLQEMRGEKESLAAAEKELASMKEPPRNRGRGRPETFLGATMRMGGLRIPRAGSKFILTPGGRKLKEVPSEKFATMFDVRALKESGLTKRQINRVLHSRKTGGIQQDEFALRMREAGFPVDSDQEAFDILIDPDKRMMTADDMNNPELLEMSRTDLENLIDQMKAKKSERDPGEEGFADIKDQGKFNFLPVNIPGQSKDQAALELIRKILQAPDSAISRRDILGMKKGKKKATDTETPLFQTSKKGLF